MKLLTFYIIIALTALLTPAKTVHYEREEPEPPSIEEATSTPDVVPGEVSAYTSSVGETDSTPFITASGHPTGPGVVACPNDLPFGTQVEIKGEVYTCLDRMNPRYEDNGIYEFDIWMPEKRIALAWGRQHIPVRILD